MIVYVVEETREIKWYGNIKVTGGEEMIVYVVEETRETNWQDFERRNVAVYETESEALEKIKQLREKNKYNDYDIIAYDTETGGIIND